MTRTTEPDRQDMDTLLSYLPGFENPGRIFIVLPSEKELEKFGLFCPPTYPDDVSKFFRVLQQDIWMDFGYNPEQVKAMLDDPSYIAQANVTQMKSMFTYIARAERFCDGAWGSALESGVLQTLLHRLEELKHGLNSEE